MKFDFKKIQELASQVPDIISKGQQVIGSMQTVVKTFRTKDTAPNSALLAELKPQSADKGEGELKEEGVIESEYKKSESLEFAVAGMGYLRVPGDVTAMIGEMARQANETMRFCEEQKTIRAEIRANADVEISKINAMADMVRDYLKRSFDERAGLFDNYFSVLDKALESGDNTLVAQTLQSINSLAASSPFKDLADINKVSALLSEGGEWDI
ncbi:MAG: hypothetical protein K2H96_10805 [Muribaculaceae bacterium]|nr:hypothetical protein [Muribaculaceae bacterium]